MKSWSYHFVFIVFCLITHNPAAFSQEQNRETTANSRPNVLFIAVDDLNDWIEPLSGHPQARTPHLSRLAKSGVLFTNAHCQAPICNPSRVSLMIGKRPSSTGIYYLGPLLRNCDATRSAVSLPQHFAKHGYKTMAAGKLFHQADRLEFQTYAGNFGGFGPRPNKPLDGGQTHPLWDWGAFPDSDQQMPDHRIADWTINQLKQKHARPFFLACGFYRPHVPMFAPKKWFDLHPLEHVQLPATRPDDFDDVPKYAQDLSWSLVAPRHKWMTKNRQWKKAVQAYLASVSFVDAQIGRVLEALEKSEHHKNTLVVLWSDHGFHLGTKERWGKRSLWDDSTRVVLMIRGPGIKPNQVCQQPVGLIDLYPTLIDLCRLSMRTGLEGHSLRPLLEKPDTVWPWPAITTFGANNHSIRGLRFRYSVYADGSEELYDLKNDPHEFVNKIDDPTYATHANRLKKILPQINHPMAPGSHHADARPGSAAEIAPDKARREKQHK